MKKLIILIAFINLNLFCLLPNNYYQNSYDVIHYMLLNNNLLSFKTAVFATENAFLEGKLNDDVNNQELELLIQISKVSSNKNLLLYGEKDIELIKKQASIFKVITDSTSLIIDSIHTLVHLPFSYDFVDTFGEEDWTKMFVSKLLTTGKGNCHSLPYLYKILAEEMGIPAYLAFAPNHIYIKSYSEKTGWYNTELTSGTFPIDAWIIASGYVTVEAIQNGLYMDTLSTKQSVANCLVDLAQGYQRKFGKDNPDFVVKCCNTCLQYHPTNVNAMLTKAEAQKYYIQAQMKAKNLKKPRDLFADNSIKKMYEDMEQTYVRLHQLGYRRMPEEMYMQWIEILNNEKYNNINIL